MIVSNFPTRGESGILYAVCHTETDQVEKVATAGFFTLEIGSVVSVKFDNPNSAENPTLNINGTGAKAIKKFGTTAVDCNMWQAGAIVAFTYDGTNWVMGGGTTATTSYYGVTKLNSSINSTSTTEAATPSAVKNVYDMLAALLAEITGWEVSSALCTSDGNELCTTEDGTHLLAYRKL